jgi:hypothetical protein
LLPLATGIARVRLLRWTLFVMAILYVIHNLQIFREIVNYLRR